MKEKALVKRLSSKRSITINGHTFSEGRLHVETSWVVINYNEHHVDPA